MIHVTMHWKYADRRALEKLKVKCHPPAPSLGLTEKASGYGKRPGYVDSPTPTCSQIFHPFSSQLENPTRVGLVRFSNCQYLAKLWKNLSVGVKVQEEQIRGPKQYSWWDNQRWILLRGFTFLISYSFCGGMIVMPQFVMNHQWISTIAIYEF